MSKSEVRLAVPNKGRLSEKAVEVLRRAGIRLDYSNERKLFATALGGGLKVLFLRAADIPEFVSDGIVDAGITGYDLVAEQDRPVELLSDLGFGKCRLVVAVPSEAPYAKAADLPAGTKVATSFPNVSRAWFRDQGLDVRIVPVSGATEVTPHIGLAEAIVDLVSTGSTLAMNNMRELDGILASSARLIANAAALKDPEKGPRLLELRFALDSVVAAEGKRYLLADVPEEALEEIRQFLPGIAGPTVVDIAGSDGMVAIQVVVDEEDIYGAVNRLKALGAKGILVVPIDRMVP